MQVSHACCKFCLSSFHSIYFSRCLGTTTTRAHHLVFTAAAPRRPPFLLLPSWSCNDNGHIVCFFNLFLIFLFFLFWTTSTHEGLDLPHLHFVFAAACRRPCMPRQTHQPPNGNNDG